MTGHRVAVFVGLAMLSQAGLAAQQSKPVAGTPAPLAVELKAGLERRLDAIAAGLDGVLGLAVLDLTSGEPIATRFAGEPFPTASTIKLAVLYELFKQADEGRLTLDQPLPLARDRIVGGSGVLQHLTSPVLPLRDYATLMIVLSDNTATNIVIDAVGMPAVATRMQTLGFGDVRLGRKMMDLAAAKRGDENVASPSSLARLAALLWKGDGLTDRSRASASTMLRAVSGAVRAAVPRATPVASKTGELDGVRAEAAVVGLDGRPFALAVMTTYLKNDADGVRATAEVASAAFDYFNRIAHGGKYGRQIP